MCYGNVDFVKLALLVVAGGASVCVCVCVLLYKLTVTNVKLLAAHGAQSGSSCIVKLHYCTGQPYIQHSPLTSLL